MSPRRFRVWLSLAALVVGMGACEINPQPPLPGRDPSMPALNGGNANGSGAGSSAGGTLNLEGATGGTSTKNGGMASGPDPADNAAGESAGGGPGESGAAGESGTAGGADGAGGAPPQ